MEFATFWGAASIVLVGVFVLAFVMGAVANKTNFCTMGAVSDWVNINDLGRMRSWLLAIAVAILGVGIFEAMGWLSADGSFPPYRSGQFQWAEHLLGGLLFGVGMTLASGCGNKTLVRVGGGNLKSVMVVLIIAVIAYFMVISPLPGTDQTLYSLLFYPWMNPLVVNVGSGQDIGSLLGGGFAVKLGAALVIAAALLFFVFKSKEFRTSRDNVLGGLVIGLVIVGAWWLTSNVVVGDDMGQYTPREYVQEWDFLSEGDEVRPAQAGPWGNQSFTFINPMGQSLSFAANGFSSAYLFFGVVAFFGVILGSFFWAIVSKGFRIEWFASWRDFANHAIGGVLMGFGGVLAMGCTIGQGITGISTLALGGFLTFIAIVFGAALTMKIQYYKLVYEEEASFVKALITSLVDMRLLPKAFRRLEAV
ncbi:MAG: YeeE/YedE family protein [Thioalkalivibrionaceae bacterium]